jgi:hypothetical protein
LIIGRSFYELRCHCYKARSLIASDETGFSDPYLSITVGNETQTTPVSYSFIYFNIIQIYENLFLLNRFSWNHYVHNGI